MRLREPALAGALERDTPHRPKFQHDTGFYDELKQGGDHYFEATGLGRQASPRMYLESAVILLWFA